MKQSSISRKIAIMCILLAAAICAGVCISGYFEYRNSIYRTYNNFGYEMAEVALTFVDGDRVADYLISGETDPAYDEMADNIRMLYDNTSLSAIYICVPDGETDTVATIYDVRVHYAENPELYSLGVVDPIGASADTVVNIYRTGERAEDYFIRKNSFGYNASAIVPVKDSAGNATALLVVDVPMPYINSLLREYLISTIGITVLLVFVMTFAYMAYMRRRLVQPILLISKSAEAFVENQQGFSQGALQIRTGDELEALARSLEKMEVDISRYIESLARITADKERIATELAVATQIQTSMLPCIFPPFPDRQEFDIYASMDPAKEVGGDFYDFFMVDERHLAIVMADVSGKGVPAALFMVIGKTLIKDHTYPGCDLGEVFSEVNTLLCDSNSEGMFITAFEGILDLVSGELRFVNAGHEMPFISRAGQPFQPQKVRAGFVLAGMEGMKYRAGSIQLEPGDKLFQYTDGVPEATNCENSLYGMERLQKLLSTVSDKSPQDILSAVKADVDAFVGDAPQFDDITMLCLEFRQRMQEGAQQ